MNSDNNNHDHVGKYSVVSVEKTEAPAGMPGNNWHCYVIGVGNSKMVGNKPGTLQDVTEHARAVVDDLNERASRSGSVYAPRLRK
jgi:hypothetical protein